MRKTILWIPGLLLLTGSFQCQKKYDCSQVLPPVTQEGNNTFACRMNGKVWAPYGSCSVGSGETLLRYFVTASDSPAVSQIGFYLGSQDFRDSKSAFYIEQTGRLADHIVGTGNIIDSLYISFLKGGTAVFYYVNPYLRYDSHLFQVTKLDTANKIFSGVFAFTMYTRDFPPDSIVVTEGRFDLRICKAADECSN